ncbi:MAG: hypothetical protein NTW95_13420 [Candidatus Aminicenantes bacterium]|nr:hypothetical protein [Candidatus Aminicenantes bacterium]
MNKKMMVLTLVLVMLLVMPACKKKTPGRLSNEGALAMVPDGASMLLNFDFLKFSDLALFDKMLKDDWKKDGGPGKVFADYPDFVQKTGIDLKKDVYAVTAGIYGELGGAEPQMVALVNLKYDKEKVLGLLRQNNVIVAEEKYRGLGLYTLKGEESNKDGLRTLSAEGSKKEARLVFLTPYAIAIGTEAQVKLAVDLAQGSGASILKNAAMMKYVDKLQKDSMLWLAIGNIPDKLKNAPAGGMMPVDLSKAEAFIGYVDYKSKTFSGKFQLLSNNEAGNKQVVDMLNGLKALGAMGSAKEPELGQLLNAIQLSASADAITLSFSLPEELMNKLSDKAKDKAKGMMPPAAPAEGVPQQ